MLARTAAGPGNPLVTLRRFGYNAGAAPRGMETLPHTAAQMEDSLMTKNWLVLATALFAIACNDKGDDSGNTPTDGGATDGGADGGTTPALTLDCAWGGGGIDVILTNGDSAGYNFGLAETNGNAQAWTGEDCYLGYLANDGTLYDFCHPLAASGGFLTSVGSFDDIVEGSTTIHTAAIENTYYLEEVSSGSCWTWGDDTSYYGGLGCADVGGPCTGE